MHLLRIQVNPHFLFNTLNNIDALIKINPVKASEYLHKLSQFMRQLVYQTEDAWQPLDREILLIEDYVELQQLRSNDPIQIHWSIQGPTEDALVPPMLLLPLIENCFKHGLIQLPHPLTIRINVDVHGIQITFINAIDASNSSLVVGLGLELTRKRLLAMYGNSAELKAGSTVDGYIQTISITNTI
jgi:LytS/YehU family sensor histidine kinase